MADHQDDSLLTIPDLKRKLSLGTTAVHALLRSGRLPSLRIGRARRIRPEALAAFIAASESAEVRS